MLNAISKNTLKILMFLSFIFLMVIRVDWWWWGEKIEPLVFGWLTYPMIYQLGIWFLGYLVVIITVIFLWPDSE